MSTVSSYVAMLDVELSQLPDTAARITRLWSALEDIQRRDARLGCASKDQDAIRTRIDREHRKRVQEIAS